jgi:hypothetical protein
MYQPLICKLCGKVLGNFHGYEQGSIYRAHLQTSHTSVFNEGLELKKKVAEFKTKYGHHAISLI